MPRPRGLRMNRFGLQLFMSANRLSMTEVAEEWGMSLKTLSGLAHGDHGASVETVRRIERRIGEDHAKAIFPELAGFLVTQ